MPTQPPPRLRPTILLPAWGVRTLGLLVLCTGLILPWWIITERTKQATNNTQTDLAAGPLRPEMVIVPQTVIPTDTRAQQSTPSPQQTPPPLPFAISVTEITQGQYQRVMGGLPPGVHTATTGAQDACVQSDADPNLPVVCVTWLEALEFCNRLSALEGLDSCYEQRGDTYGWLETSCTGYRLPTKKEWQYAAQAASAFRYAGTDSDTDICRYANIGDQSASQRDQFSCDDGYARLAPVAHFLTNAWFVYDMTGNVAEWVWTRVSSRAPLEAAEAGAAELMGGDWSSGINAAGLGYEVRELPADPSERVGFRIARTDPQRAQQALPGDESFCSDQTPARSPTAGFSRRRDVGRAFMPGRGCASAIRPARHRSPRTALLHQTPRGDESPRYTTAPHKWGCT